MGMSFAVSYFECTVHLHFKFVV
uniref:Uncharacterized protein n=1 Tax=Anguilla anguilla TaxID=7936 RepID=A0A0E9S5C1_ANGAN